jgi:hypothetical protein
MNKVNIDNFMWHKNTRTLTAEASELPHDFRPLLSFVGYKDFPTIIVKGKTKDVKFYIEKGADFNEDYMRFKPINNSDVDDLMIYND